MIVVFQIRFGSFSISGNKWKLLLAQELSTVDQDDPKILYLPKVYYKEIEQKNNEMLKRKSKMSVD